MSLNLLLVGADRHSMIDEIQLAWFAGLFEGEGCISATQKGKRGGVYLVLRIGMTDKDVLERAAEIVGGTVCGPYESITPRGGPGKPKWTWTVCRTDDVIALSKNIYPYLGERRRAQIDKAIEAQRWADPIPVMEERFWRQVEKADKCWLWTGHIDKYGFGTWCYEMNKRIQAHRYSLGLVGDVPSRVVNVCGTKSCVRPDHWRRDGK